jgi:hypothetical protein
MLIQKYLNVIEQALDIRELHAILKSAILCLTRNDYNQVELAAFIRAESLQ